MFRYQAKVTKFKHDSINISDEFLQSKMPQFETIYPDIKDPVQLYMKVNRDLRQINLRQLKEFAQKTSPRMLWEGPFLRLPNAAPKAGFGDGRTYMYRNQKIDEETHLGVDLASLENAQVPAANNGVVIFTGFLGIYGNAVVIDHGWGPADHLFPPEPDTHQGGRRGAPGRRDRQHRGHGPGRRRPPALRRHPPRGRDPAHRMVGPPLDQRQHHQQIPVDKLLSLSSAAPRRPAPVAVLFFLCCPAFTCYKTPDSPIQGGSHARHVAPFLRRDA